MVLAVAEGEDGEVVGVAGDEEFFGLTLAEGNGGFVGDEETSLFDGGAVGRCWACR